MNHKHNLVGQSTLCTADVYFGLLNLGHNIIYLLFFVFMCGSGMASVGNK